MTVGIVWTARSQLPWSATAGRDLNKDGFTSDLVPGTTRNSGSRNLNLDAVNVYRAANGLSPVTASQIDSSAFNIADMRLGKSFVLRGRTKLDIVAQVFNFMNTTNLQDQYGGGRTTNALSAVFGSIQTARPKAQGELAVKLGW